MATITQTTGVSSATTAVTLASQVLTASDSFTYQPGAGQLIMFDNTTGSSVTATLTGSAPVAIAVPGYGSVTPTSKAIIVAAGTFVHLKLDNISAYLAGSGLVTVTGGTGLTVTLYA